MMAQLLKFTNIAIFGKKVLKKSFPAAAIYHRFIFQEAGISSLKSVTLNVDSNSKISTVRCYAKKAQGKAPKGGKTKTVTLSDEELNDVINLSEYRYFLSTIKEKMKQDFIDHLSLHAFSGSIDQLPVTIENETYPLNELAQISKKGQNLICINLSAFPEGLKPTLQAISESGTGFNPQQEGTMIYLTIPKITREHRETLAKNAKSMFTKSKDEVKQIQNQFVRDAKRKNELSEDLTFNASKQIMHIAEECITELEKIMKTRQNELLKED